MCLCCVRARGQNDRVVVWSGGGRSKSREEVASESRRSLVRSTSSPTHLPHPTSPPHSLSPEIHGLAIHPIPPSTNHQPPTTYPLVISTRPENPTTTSTCPTPPLLLLSHNEKANHFLNKMSFRSSTRTALKQALQAATSANSKRSFSLVAKAAVRPQVARTTISVSRGGGGRGAGGSSSCWLTSRFW